VPTTKLPVIATAVEAIKYPLRYPWEFIRFGCLTLGLSLLMGWLDSSASTPRAHPDFAIVGVLVFLLGFLASTFVIAPFEVTWIRLTLNGSRNVSDRPIWVFGKPERQLLIAEFALSLIAGAPGILAFIVALIVHQATTLMGIVIFVAAGLLIAGLGCSIRLSFVLIEVALQRYDDWRNSWNQTRGRIWRLIGIGLLASLPYGIVGSLLGGWIFFEHASGLVMIGGEAVEVLLTFAGVSAGWSALALAYQFTAPEPSNTGAVATN
jgi:hypothetical protein